MRFRFSTLALLLASTAFPALAQDLDDSAATPESDAIIVTAERIKGSVDTDVPPTLVVDEKDIASYGASTVTDLLGALGPQTRSGGGRGGGMPIMLLNGRRVSSFAEMRDLPPEAIKRVEVFPEEVALKLGFAPDQRVVNFILKPGFAAVSGELEYAFPQEGGRGESEVQATWLKVMKNGRLNLSAQYDRDTALLESERGIVEPGTFDSAAYRTLLPAAETLQLNSVFNRAYDNGVGYTLNLRYDLADTRSRQGLPITGGSDPLDRRDNSRTFHTGLTLDGAMSGWQWSLTGNVDFTRGRSQTERDLTPLIALDLGRTKNNSFNGTYTISGSPMRVPAGRVSVNFRAGFDQLDFKSRTVSLLNGNRVGDVSRGVGLGRVNIDIPLASRRNGVAQPLGDLSINGYFGHRHLTDFGGLSTYGYGLTWSPVRGLTATASFTAEDAAPSPQQLADPSLVAPLINVFDFVRGETALVSITRGGNPDLGADKRRDIKLGLAFTPPKLEALSIEANYFRTRSTNPIASFPALTSATALAFPGRFTRDTSGRLLAIDQRAVNLASTRADTLRWGLMFSKAIGKQPAAGQNAGGQRPPGGVGGGFPGGGRPGGPGGGARPGGGRGGMGGGMGGFGPPGAGRWFVALYHNYKFKDEAVLAPGVAPLDLLGGDSLSGSGSTRHTIELESGLFHKGIGMRLAGNWQGGTQVFDASGNGLRFSSLTTLNLRMFVNMDQRGDLTKKMPFLKGSRIAFRVNNLLNTIQNVRDETGLVPFRYQSPFLDPLGRTFEFSFRKLF